ncbi:MAG: dihydroneopterin aldolase [Bacteroidales bacterium]|nr:dihydroneopterin aldolase [Bacteroidales bacterium]
MDYLLINNMQFYAYHGVYEQENKVGNNYLVDLKLGIDLSNACKSDSLEDTINYASVFDKVSTVMQKPCKLIEYLAENICIELKTSFQKIQSIEIKVTKVNPPIQGQINSVSVILFR